MSKHLPTPLMCECARDQLQSLLVYEGECGRKDRVTKELRKEPAYKQNSHSK